MLIIEKTLINDDNPQDNDSQKRSVMDNFSVEEINTIQLAHRRDIRDRKFGVFNDKI